MAAPKWVKLHLVAQTEGSNMPPFVIGLLTGEVPGGYVLNPMVDIEVNEDTFEETLVNKNMHIISKTYVWDCEILEEKPGMDIVKASQEELVSGGLG